MGQKVNPHGIRVGVIKDWDSRWYAEADFADYLVEDYNIRTFLKKKLYSAGVSKLDLSNLSAYDQGCNEEFQNAMKNYFEGTATKEEALDLFYKAVVEKYPELTY